MSRGGGGVARVDRRSRTWWLAPLSVVVTTAVAVTVLLAPRLGAHVAVPRRLVLSPSASTGSAPPSHPPTHATSPTPTPSATPSPQARTTTQVVQPQRPVVTVHDDDGKVAESGDG